MHAHLDHLLLQSPSYLAKITQSVKFEVLGQERIRYAPVNGKYLTLILHQIAIWNGNPSEYDFWIW